MKVYESVEKDSVRSERRRAKARGVWNGGLHNAGMSICIMTGDDLLIRTQLHEI